MLKDCCIEKPIRLKCHSVKFYCSTFFKFFKFFLCVQTNDNHLYEFSRLLVNWFLLEWNKMDELCPKTFWACLKNAWVRQRWWNNTSKLRFFVVKMFVRSQMCWQHFGHKSQTTCFWSDQSWSFVSHEISTFQSLLALPYICIYLDTY